MLKVSFNFQLNCREWKWLKLEKRTDLLVSFLFRSQYQCKKIRSGGKKRTRSSISGGENNENGDSEMDQSLDGTNTELNQQLDNALSGLSS